MMQGPIFLLWPPTFDYLLRGGPEDGHIFHSPFPIGAQEYISSGDGTVYGSAYGYHPAEAAAHRPILDYLPGLVPGTVWLPLASSGEGKGRG
jgi:hypothetical protein